MPSGCMGTFTLSVRIGRRPMTVLGVHSEEEGRAGEESREGGKRKGRRKREGRGGEGKWRREERGEAVKEGVCLETAPCEHPSPDGGDPPLSTCCCTGPSTSSWLEPCWRSTGSTTTNGWTR